MNNTSSIKSSSEDLEISPVVGISALPYMAMTYPYLMPRLNAGGSHALHFGATVDGRPVGLLMAARSASGRSGKLDSVFVEPAFRRRGIAGKLMEHLNQECRFHGVQEMEATWVDESDRTMMAGGLLEGSGWTTPRPSAIVCRGRKRILSMDLVEHLTSRFGTRHRRHSLPEHWSIERWVDISSEVREELEERGSREGWLPQDVKPSRHDRNIEPDVSLAALENGRIMGWVLVQHRVPEWLTVGSSFMEPNHARQGRMYALYREFQAAIVRKHQDKVGLTFSVPPEHEFMERMVKRRWKGFLDTIETFMKSTRSFEKKSPEEKGVQ